MRRVLIFPHRIRLCNDSRGRALGFLRRSYTSGYALATPWSNAGVPAQISALKHGQPGTKEATIFPLDETGLENNLDEAFSDKLQISFQSTQGNIEALAEAPGDVAEEQDASSDENLNPQSPPVGYGKWQWLSLEPQKLEFESDVACDESLGARLVDLVENENDIQLWLCILNYRHRSYGTDGIRQVLSGLCRRKCLWDVDSSTALEFWHTIARACLLHEHLLTLSWQYAEWLYEKHEAAWPGLYKSILPSLLALRQTERAFRWHMRLSPSFGSSERELGELLKSFLTNPDRELEETLELIYTTSRHRGLYDEIIPFLYAHGDLRAAGHWRKIMLLHDDEPKSNAARPFLLFAAGYLKSIDPLVSSELRAAGLEEDMTAKDVANYKTRADHEVWYLLNRVHGETFGIKEKTYSDTLGAQWFASSWMPLSMAVDVIRGLGYNSIGPLSLQSIALRETSPKLVHARIQSLKEQGISTGSTIYSRALELFAAVEDEEMLSRLLHSDIHPEVYDDKRMRGEALEVCKNRQDWKTYELILAVKAARLCFTGSESADIVTKTSNYLVAKSLGQDDLPQMLQTVQAMAAGALQLFPLVSDAISAHIFYTLGPQSGVSSGAKNQDKNVIVRRWAQICLSLAKMQYTLATNAFSLVLSKLCQRGCLDLMDELAIALAHRWGTPQLHHDPMMLVHKYDLPTVIRDVPSKNGPYLPIPRSLNTYHSFHPLRLIFSVWLQQIIVHHTFRVAALHPSHSSEPREDNSLPSHYSYARGVRLLAMLQRSGVFVPVERMKQTVMKRMADVYGRRATKRTDHDFIYKNVQLSLAQMKALYDEAWGEEFLASASEMADRIANWDQAQDLWRKPWEIPKSMHNRTNPWKRQPNFRL